MVKKYLRIFAGLTLLLTLMVTGCTATGKKGSKVFKHDTPLIKQDVKKFGASEVDKTVDMGPVPTEADVVKLKKKISSVKKKNYLLIPEEFTDLKQQVHLNFKTWIIHKL